MKYTGKLIFFSLLVWGLLFVEALADEIILQNGDRLTGEVIALEENKLIFKTSYAGELFIVWAEVEKIRVDKPAGVLLEDDVSLNGVIETAEDGRMTIRQDETRQRVFVDLEEVKRINPQQTESPKTEYNMRANVGITIESGNTEKEKFHLDGRFGARKQQLRFSVGFEYDYESNNDEKTKNKLLASTNLDYFFKYPWYVYGKGAYEFDEFKDLDLKLDIGPGLGYQFIEGENANLALEAGPSYVKQDFKKESRRNYIAARSAISADKWFFDKFVQFYLSAEGFENPDEKDDRFARVRSGLRYPLGWGFSMSTQYNLDYDNNPPEGIEGTDQRLIFLLGYDK
jgi:putative salt-induced outer membrane protein YdiY